MQSTLCEVLCLFSNQFQKCYKHSDMCGSPTDWIIYIISCWLLTRNTAAINIHSWLFFHTSNIDTLSCIESTKLSYVFSEVYTKKINLIIKRFFCCCAAFTEIHFGDECSQELKAVIFSQFSSRGEMTVITTWKWNPNSWLLRGSMEIQNSSALSHYFITIFMLREYCIVAPGGATAIKAETVCECTRAN